MLKDTQRLDDVIMILSKDICVRIIKLVADSDTKGREFVNGGVELVGTDWETIMEQLISSRQYYVRMRSLIDNTLLREEKKGHPVT